MLYLKSHELDEDLPDFLVIHMPDKMSLSQKEKRFRRYSFLSPVLFDEGIQKIDQDFN